MTPAWASPWLEVAADDAHPPSAETYAYGTLLLLAYVCAAVLCSAYALAPEGLLDAAPPAITMVTEQRMAEEMFLSFRMVDC